MITRRLFLVFSIFLGFSSCEHQKIQSVGDTPMTVASKEAGTTPLNSTNDSFESIANDVKQSSETFVNEIKATNPENSSSDTNDPNNQTLNVLTDAASHLANTPTSDLQAAISDPALGATAVTIALEQFLEDKRAKADSQKQVLNIVALVGGILYLAIPTYYIFAARNEIFSVGKSFSTESKADWKAIDIFISKQHEKAFHWTETSTEYKNFKKALLSVAQREGIVPKAYPVTYPTEKLRGKPIANPDDVFAIAKNKANEFTTNLNVKEYWVHVSPSISERKIALERPTVSGKIWTATKKLTPALFTLLFGGITIASAINAQNNDFSVLNLDSPNTSPVMIAVNKYDAALNQCAARLWNLRAQKWANGSM